MSAPSIPIGADDMRLLAEIGFTATQSGEGRAARGIFRGLLLLRPQSTLPYIGLALAEMALGRHEEAARLLQDEALALHPRNAELEAFLGLALCEAGHRAEAASVLAAMLPGACDDDPHVRMARGLLATLSSSGAPPPSARAVPLWSQSV